jgi:tetratricopeptide (TPR) repeat protein
MYKFFAAIVLSLTPALLPLSAASLQATPIPVTENPSPEIDATTQKWLDRLQQIATHLSDPSEKVHIWLGLADLYINTYSDRQQGEAAITQAITTARSIPDPASKAQTLRQIIQFPYLEPSATAAILDLLVESIPEIANESQQQDLLESVVGTAIKLQTSIQLPSSAQPLTLVEQIQSSNRREWWRSQVIEAQVRQLIVQKQMTAAIALIETMPLPPAPIFQEIFQETVSASSPTSDQYWSAKIDQVNSILGDFYLPSDRPVLPTNTALPPLLPPMSLVDRVPLTELDLTQILPPFRTTVQSWLDRIQDPYTKAKAQSRWIERLNYLGQVQESSDLYQDLLQSLPNQTFSPQQKAQLLLPFWQYSWASDPETQPLIQQTIQAFQTQLDAIGNSGSAQDIKAELLQEAISSAFFSSPQVLAALTDSVNTLSNLKLRSSLLYKIASLYESNGQESEANAIYKQILPIFNHLENQSQAVVILLKLGQIETAIEHAKKNGTDSVLYKASVTLVEQKLTSPALELARLIQEPVLKSLALAEASVALPNSSQVNALFQEAIAYIQTLSESDQRDAIDTIGHFFNDNVPIQIIDLVDSDLKVALLLSIVAKYGLVEIGDTSGWAETERNNQIAQSLAHLLPHITQSTQKSLVLMTLVSLDAADHPDRVSQWIDQLPPNAQANALLRAIYIRSHPSP